MFQILASDLYLCVGYLGTGQGGTGIPTKLAYIIALIYRGIQIVIPILLILWGMLDLGKAVMAQKEEEIKKGQQTFIKRIVAAAIVFFVLTIVKLMIGLVADDKSSTETLTTCIDSIIECKNTDCN